MSAEFDNKQERGCTEARPDLSYCLPTDVTQNFKRDRFELLSAYLDGEVTAAERRQVEHWLDTDPAMQKLHGRLLSLRQGMQTLATAPAPSSHPDATVQQVMQRLERRPRRLVAVSGMATVAAVFLGAILVPVLRVPSSQFAEVPAPAADSSAGLMIALDSPVIEIPEVVKSGPKDFRQ